MLNSCFERTCNANQGNCAPVSSHSRPLGVLIASVILDPKYDKLPPLESHFWVSRSSGAARAMPAPFLGKLPLVQCFIIVRSLLT